MEWGAAASPDIRTCDPDGGQKDRNRRLGLGLSVFRKRFGNSIREDFGGVILADAAHHLKDIIRDKPLIVNRKSV